MTNTQLYLSLGIPAVLILTNIALTLFLVGRLESRIDRVDSKLDATRLEVDSKLDTTRLGMDSKLDAIRIELVGRMDSRFDKVDGDMRHFFGLYGRHEKAIEILEKRSER